MAARPVFIPDPASASMVRVERVEFRWFPGLSLSQKQRSISSLHEAATRLGAGDALEISTKSPSSLGRALSAFVLQAETPVGKSSVESLFQGSKVFRLGGPYDDLIGRPPRQAKQDPRLLNSGPLIAFDEFGSRWPLDPPTVFYDWIYCSALYQHQDLALAASAYGAFTDIEFNPERSLNCQARSVALFVSLRRLGLLDRAMSGRTSFLEVCGQSRRDEGRLF